MKTMMSMTAGVACLFVASCASQTPQTADYNGDGVISNGEYDQFLKRKSVESVNMENERRQMQNVSENINSAVNTVNGFQQLSNMLGGH